MSEKNFHGSPASARRRSSRMFLARPDTRIPTASPSSQLGLSRRLIAIVPASPAILRNRPHFLARDVLLLRGFIARKASEGPPVGSPAPKRQRVFVGDDYENR